MKKNGNAFQLQYRQDEADWSRDMRNKQMQLSVHLQNWTKRPSQCAGINATNVTVGASVMINNQKQTLLIFGLFFIYYVYSTSSDHKNIVTIHNINKNKYNSI